MCVYACNVGVSKSELGSLSASNTWGGNSGATNKIGTAVLEYIGFGPWWHGRNGAARACASRMSASGTVRSGARLRNAIGQARFRGDNGAFVLATSLAISARANKHRENIVACLWLVGIAQGNLAAGGNQCVKFKF